MFGRMVSMKIHPGWCGSVHWAPACEKEVTGLIPSQGTCLDFWPGSPVGGVQETTNQCISLTSTFLSLSSSLPSPLPKEQIHNIFKNNNTFKKKINGKCNVEILLMRKILSHTLQGAEGIKVFKNCKLYNLENKVWDCVCCSTKSWVCIVIKHY